MSLNKINYKEDLLNKILPFWIDNAIDYKNGGIYTCLTEKGEIYGTEKSVWFQGRALWAFSKAYNCINKNEDYLKAAEAIYVFLPNCTDSDGRMFFTVTEDGREIQKRRYYFSETFAAIGCAEFYKATGREEVKAAAEKYFDTAYKCFCGEIKTEPKFNTDTLNSKALSPVMIMLATAQVMRSMCKERYGYYNDIAKKCLDEILYGGYLKEKALLENVSVKGEFINTPMGRTVNPGHSMEAAWFIMAEGLHLNDEEVINKGLEIIDKTYPLGWDKKNGGIIAFTDVLGNPPSAFEWDMKLWWPQCETMIAARLAYSITKKEKYNNIYEDLKEYCEKYFVDTIYGEWYGYLHYDNSVSADLKGNIFKGPFHIPRMYMIMAIMDETGSITGFMN